MKKFIYKDVQFFYSIDNPQNLDTINFNNHQLNNLRIFCKNNFPGILGKKEYELYFYEGREINAVTFLDNKGNGIIAFPSEFFTLLRDIIEKLIYAEPSIKIFDIYTKAEANNLVNSLFEYIIIFVITHELSHLERGHCGYLNKIGIYCSENEMHFEEDDEEKNFLLQTIELDADTNAIFLTLNYFINHTIDLIKENKLDKNDCIPFLNEIQDIICSMYLLNILFNFDNNSVEFKTYLENFYSEKHPFPSLRILNILSQIEVYMENFLSPDELAFVYNNAIGKCISIDRIFFANGDFKKSLIAVSSTKDGSLHLQKLYKNWNVIINDIQKFSFIQLEKICIPKTMSYWVDENGNMSETMFKTEKVK
ncbi:hypothetical protein [Treponema bryantii]|uniref:hypothetical protein n=1 Tax=Treponema bryantii TaxID=163 RepID=UPI002B2DB14C|nr:hypothetical protein TRBR_17270 [Treponema bryantii]